MLSSCAKCRWLTCVHTSRSLDKELGTHLRLKNPAFKVNLLSFCQTSRDTDSMTAEQAVDKKTQAEYQCLKFKLQAESTMFQAHILALAEWERATSSSRAERLQKIDELVETTTAEYCDLRFPMLQLSEKDQADNNKCVCVCVRVPLRTYFLKRSVFGASDVRRWRLPFTQRVTASHKKRPPSMNKHSTSSWPT